jgi:hypothetical protein
MAKEIINEEFELPDDAVEDDNSEIEFEIVDDTPEEDRGRQPLTEEEEDEREEELESLSKSVQKRINKLTHRYNDERREKERLAREHAEALRIAQALLTENQRIQQFTSAGLEDYTKTKQSQLELEQRLAEDKYRKAYESGDTEGTLEANKELARISAQQSRLYEDIQKSITNFAPPLQNVQQPVYNIPQPAQQAPAPSARALDWKARNPWFHKDEEMTSLALGLHQKLVNSGYDPESDEYYQQIDSGLRRRFPEKFERPKKASPVAPAGRSSAPKKVTLTQTEANIAKRLGITNEQYWRSKVKGATING